MADKMIDMLELAKRLIPDVETGMPEDVAKAFAEGRIKTIFRTADSISIQELTSGLESRISGVLDPGSTYFLDEEGKIARYGRHGHGWGDARVASELKSGSSGKSSFLDRAVFGKTIKQDFDRTPGKAPSEVVDNFIKEGGFTEPVLGGTIIEFDNDLSRIHKGHSVSDIYRSTGEVEFVSQLTEGESVGGKVRPTAVKTNIENISIEKNRKGHLTPRLTEPSKVETTIKDTTAKIGSDAVDSSVSAPTGSRLRGKGLNPTLASSASNDTPSTDAIKAAMGNPPSPTVEPDAPKNLTPQQQALIDTMKAEKAAAEETARKAIPATRQSIEESGYLYHYAPREARESIVSGGFDVSKARTAVSDIAGAGSEFATHVPDNSMYFFTNPQDAPSAGTIFGTGETGQRPDLYRVKVEPGMLDDMVVDPRLPVRDGVGSAVIVPSKTGKFQAELIGENAQFGIRGENISPATYDPIAKKVDTPAPTKTPEANITAAGRNRQMVPANYSKMSDDELLSNYQSAKELYEKQLVIDPDGKAFMPTARGAVEGYERELAKRGIDPNAVAPPKMEAKVTSENVSSKPAGEAVAPASDSVDKAKGGRKGPSSLGTPADVRTRPTPLGTTNASPQVTQNGTVKPPTSVPTPTTSNTNPNTAVNNTQAKVTSQAVTQTDDAVDSVSKVKRVSTRGKTLLDNGMETAKNLASGNARTMGIAGAAALLGAGAFAMKRKSEEDIEARLNRQRYGEMR